LSVLSVWVTPPQKADDEVITFRPAYLVALKTEEGLTVYRSVLVKDTSPMYQSVIEQLDGYQLVSSSVCVDPAMMFGKAEELIYRRVDV
jgi:hypothetical protein